jgi:C4-dicarboxylate-specific signal transduction histidine kinase
MAYELNHLPGASWSNAPATQQFLAMEFPDRTAVRTALAHLTGDDQRAGKSIQQWEIAGKKSSPERVPLNMNALVQQVTHPVQSEALGQQVLLSLDQGTGLPTVYGDRIQWQQIIVHLVLNPFEVMPQLTHSPRLLMIRTAHEDATTVTVSCQNTEIDLNEATLKHMSHPFCTTEAEGLGMGLASSRTIV